MSSMADTRDRRCHLVLNTLLFALGLGSLLAQETDFANCTADFDVSVDADLTVRWTGEDRNGTVNVTLSTNDTYGRDCNAKETRSVPFKEREVKPKGFCSNAFYEIDSVVTCSRFSKKQTNTATTPPDAVEIYNVTTTNTTFEAQWRKPAGPIHGYNVRLVLDGRPVRSLNVDCSSVLCKEPLASRFTELIPYIVYGVSGSSFNQKGGWSSWGNVVKAQTKVGVPHKPKNLKAVKFKKSVTLKWEEPVPSTGPIQQYILTWAEVQEDAVRGVLPTPGYDKITSVRSFVFESLFPFTEYHARVSAETSAGRGPPAEIKVKTLLEVPDPPQMKIEGTQITSISVSWILSDYYRGPRPTYSLRWKTKEGSYTTTTDLENSSGENRYTITGLMPYSVYEVQVRGSNDAGVGRWSETQDAQTDIGTPSVPRNLRLQSTLARKATVEWDVPDPPNGPVSQIRYRVAWMAKYDTSEWNYTKDTLFQATDLTPYTDYDFEVRAESSVGASDWTDILKVKTDVSIPGAPQNLRWTKRSNTTIGIQWEPPRYKNGPNVTYFGRWIGNMMAGVSSTAYVNGTDYLIKRLIPYTNYSIDVCAKSSAGMGLCSNRILVRTVAGIPSIPKDVRTAEVYSTNLTLKWKAPVTSGGPLNGYVLHWGIRDTEGSQLRTTQDFYQALGLRPYTTYFFKIAAETEGGEGPFNVLYEQTAMSVPSVPRLTFTEVTDRCILLKWLPPEQPNGPSLWYAIQWRTVFWKVWNEQIDQLNDTTYRIKDLQPSTNYSVKICASTKAGRGPWTKTFYFETKPKDYSSAKIAGGVVGSLLLIIAISVLALLFVAKQKGGLRNIISRKTPATSSETLETSASLPMNVLSDSETVDVRNFDQHVLNLMANGYFRLAQEFEKLGKESPAFPSNEARKSDNLTKNRWVKILPFDHTRVKLLPVGDEVEHDFINASYMPGDSHLLEYIATQGPLLNTVNDFWRMAWQESVFTIVMLTQCVERAKRTCERYCPSAGETQTYGQIEVKTLSESITPGYIVRILLVSQEGKQRHIVHLQYMNWPVSGCPKSPDDFLSFIKTVRGQISCAVTGPMVVHCSAGIGRTGTFIAVDRLCQQIEHGSETVDVYGTVLEMRRHRANMVQTEEQYYFIYLCMQRIIQEKRQELESDYGAGIYTN